jgi:hypothetical protein
VAIRRTCAFCGQTERLTREHVFGAWLAEIGLGDDPVRYRAGPLNRFGRDLGDGPPFQQTVRDVCAACNNGWMSRLEEVAHRVLTPIILGLAGTIESHDRATIAMWTQKTALVAMLVSSEGARAGGYGLPRSEYTTLYASRQSLEPPAGGQFWIGKVDSAKLAMVWVTPLVIETSGPAESERPHAYAMTIVLGRLVLHGVRFTPEHRHLDLESRHAMTALWPTVTTIDAGRMTPLNEDSVLSLSGGKELQPRDARFTLGPWRPATDLNASRPVGSMVELPTICGKHVVYYPRILVWEALEGRFHVFASSCECGLAYLIETRADGAHCTKAGDPQPIAAAYDAIQGRELSLADHNGLFVVKALA